MAETQEPGLPSPSMLSGVGDLQVVTPLRWEAAREALLVKEKALMRARDELAAERRRLPVMEVTPTYHFIGPNGETDLLGLFDGRQQLIVYRFFYAPDVENWPDGACTGCSMFTDMVGHPAHLRARDTSLAFVTAAPFDMVQALRRRMGWDHLTFYSLPDESFSRDFGVEEMFGLNVFIRQGDRVFRSYFTTGRAVEEIGPVWSFLDLTPLGRQEIWQEAPDGRPQGEPYQWWRLHDAYGKVAQTAAQP